MIDLCSDGLSSDQYFLVNFIMSNYLGPDVYSDNPRCSAFQRLAQGLPPYTSKHIGSSTLTIEQLQNLYYYVLRNAKSSLLLHPDMIYMYLKGYLPLEPSGLFTQFTCFFPTNLHPQKRYSLSHEVVKGILVIDDPAVAFINKEELQRFRCLSRLNELRIDSLVSLSSPRGLQMDDSRETEQDCSRNGEATGPISSQDYNLSEEIRETCKKNTEEEAEAVASCVISKPERVSIPEAPQGMEKDCLRNGEATPSNGIVSDQEYYSFVEHRETCKRKKEEEETVAGHAVCGISKTPERFRETYKRKRFKNASKKATTKKGETLVAREKTDKPTSQALISVSPDMKECDAVPSVVTTGTASKGTLGSSVGIVDIGVNKVAYFFQVTLPGVRRDYGEFSCEIESDGKVILEGSTTTGAETIKRHSRVFEMNIRKLSPPGPFKVCFSLPGPVDPRLFSPNFRSDGIFEAVIIRHKTS